jgi:hypothetical protein
VAAASESVLLDLELLPTFYLVSPPLPPFFFCFFPLFGTDYLYGVLKLEYKHVLMGWDGIVMMARSTLYPIAFARI